MPLTRSLHFFLAGACSRGLRSAVVALALTVSLLVVSSSLVLAQNLDASSVFVEAPPYPVGGNQATSVAVADLNGDGKPDLVVGTACCNQGNNGLGPNSQVSVLLGNGDGTFQPPVSYYPFGSIAVSVAVADVNGDGKPDLVVSNSGSTLVNDSIAVLLGNGDGTFQSPLFYSSSVQNPGTLAVADVNGDGKPDIVIANGGAGVLLGNGDGTFQPVVTYSSGAGYTMLAVADVNGDGKLDIVAGNATLLPAHRASGVNATDALRAE